MVEFVLDREQMVRGVGSEVSVAMRMSPLVAG
jgi:hypothetical protein